jgi:hypothetical protein
MNHALKYLPVHMPKQTDTRSRAKSYLAFCYRSGVIGPYRRAQTAWVLSEQDAELVLDDHEVVSYLDCAIVADPEFGMAFAPAKLSPNLDSDLASAEVVRDN